MTSRHLIVAMFTAIATTTAVGVAYAADNGAHPSSSPHAGPGAFHGRFRGGTQLGHRPPGAIAGGPGRFGFGGGFAAGGFGDIGDIEHGRFVVSTQGGGEQTEVIQNGTATGVSSSSLTVRSVDGYTHSYVVNSSTNESTGCPSSKLADGDDVTVVASVNGSTDTAVSISRRVTFNPPAPGSTPSLRPTPTSTSSPGAAGSCAGFGFGGGPGFRGRFGPGR